MALCIYGYVQNFEVNSQCIHKNQFLDRKRTLVEEPLLLVSRAGQAARLHDLVNHTYTSTCILRIFWQQCVFGERAICYF